MREAIASVEQLARIARGRLRDRVVDAGAATTRRAVQARRGRLAPVLQVSPALLARHQLAVHALAHLYAELEACRALARWADEAGSAARAVAEAYTGALVLALRGGVPVGGGEIAPLGELGLREDEVARAIGHPAVAAWANDAGAGAAIAALARRPAAPHGDDAQLSWIRASTRGFVERLVAPLAPEIHAQRGLIPEALLRRMGELGAFRLSIAPEHGGDGLGAAATATAIEELSRGAASLGVFASTTALAAELIAGAGTEEQRKSLLPRVAAGDARCALALAEPMHGSDLGRIATRAEPQVDGGFVLTGSKAWVTGAARADLVITLAKTVAPSAAPAAAGSPSLFLVPKRRAEVGLDFPEPWISGVEVPALGLRGMGHYELWFEQVRLGREALLGTREGEGLRQLARALTVGRVHAAACGVGVAQAALDEAIRRAEARVPLGAVEGRANPESRPTPALVSFPRVAHRLGAAIAKVAAARQLTRAAAHAKDAGRACELDAAMAKLFAAGAALEAAEACMQMYGASGYVDGSAAARLLADARGLCVHMGTRELLAQGIARALLEGALG